jgi:hypothetical protein
MIERNPYLNRVEDADPSIDLLATELHDMSQITESDLSRKIDPDSTFYSSTLKSKRDAAPAVSLH